jgi:hypothetical protein
LLASSVGNFWPHRLAGASTTFVLMTECANYTRAIVAAAGIRRFGQARGRFDTLKGMVAFLLFAGLLAPVIAPRSWERGAVMIEHHLTDSFWLSWRAWFLSNTLTGLALSARHSHRHRRQAVRSGDEGLLASSDGGRHPGGRPHHGGKPDAAGPDHALRAWAGKSWMHRSRCCSGQPVRFGPGGTCASVLIVAVMAILGNAGRPGTLRHANRRVTTSFTSSSSSSWSPFPSCFCPR